MDKPTSAEIVKGWREEVLGYLKDMGQFENIDDPIIIMKKLSAFSSRATYMNNLSASSKNRELTEFRYDELVPFLKETDFQFRICSRIGALHNNEWEMAKG